MTESSEVSLSESDSDPGYPIDINREDISCGICGNVLTHPVTILCQHTFCYKCIQTMIHKNRETGDMKRECPMCRFPFILPMKNAKNYIMDLLIQKITKDESRIKESLKVTMKDQVIAELRQEFAPFFINRAIPSQIQGAGEFIINQAGAEIARHRAIPNNALINDMRTAVQIAQGILLSKKFKVISTIVVITTAVGFLTVCYLLICAMMR